MLEKFKKYAAAALVAFTGALPAAAEDITITEPDGTTWKSFTTTPACVEGGVKMALRENVEGVTKVFSILNSVNSTTYDGSGNTLLFIDVEYIALDESNPHDVVLSKLLVNHTQTSVDGKINGYLGKSQEKSTTISFFPASVRSGSYPFPFNGDITQIEKRAFRDGASSTLLFGSVSFDTEGFSAYLVKKIQDCQNLGLS